MSELALLFGGVGILVEWRAYLLHCDGRFRVWSAAGAVLWACQYACLGAWTAALTMGSTAARSLLSLRGGPERHGWAAGFCGLFAGLTWISWQGPVSLLPAFATINTTLALFYLAGRRMRLMLALSSVAWISNDIYWQAWPALLAESVAVLLNLRTIMILARKEKTP